MMDADKDSLVEVLLPGGTGSASERLRPEGAEERHRKTVSTGGAILLEDDDDLSEAGRERERRSQCCWVLLLVPSCSLVLTAALATLTVGALMAASCSVQVQYDAPCPAVRDAILNSSRTDVLLPRSSFRVVSSDASHVTLSHTSPVNGAAYHVYFLLRPASDRTCSCLSLASSSVWFHLDDAGAGYCALQHLTPRGLAARVSSGPTCSSRALGLCQAAPSSFLQGASPGVQSVGK